MLYPLVFQPILKPHLWGGRNLDRLYGKTLPPDVPVGESWEISDRPEGASVIGNGPLAGKDLRWLMENAPTDLLGRARPSNGRFPLLVKILDVVQSPSVQVHPPAEVAARQGGEPKSEVWYVAEAAPGAELFVGLRPQVKRGQFERKIGDGSVLDCLHRVKVTAGDAMFIPSGRVHTIGPGNVIFEIQQNSNTTYRVYDWNRLGPDGQPRSLHVDAAMASIDFEDFEPGLLPPLPAGAASPGFRTLVENPLFSAAEFRVGGGFLESVGDIDRPLILGVVRGRLRIAHPASSIIVTLAPGQFALLPASLRGVTLNAEGPATYLVAEPGVPPAPSAQEGAPALDVPTSDPAWEAYQSAPRRASDDHWRKGLPSRRRIKKELTQRLTYWPFLKLLVLRPWFRRVVVALLLLTALLALLFPKIWTVTPEGFLPVVKVSLLDRVQARVLARAALKAEAAGRREIAATAWRNAWGNNRARPSLARGLIRNDTHRDHLSPEDLQVTLSVAEWLLRLTATNRADLSLVADFYEKNRFYELIHSLLLPQHESLDPALEPLWVESLFFAGQADEFVAAWERLSPEQRADPKVSLCHDAYLAAMRSGAEAREARDRVGAAAADGSPVRLLANRVLLLVNHHRNDLRGFTNALDQLERSGAASGAEHAAYWLMLAANGRREEARTLARDYAYAPRTSLDILRLTAAYRRLGLEEEAADYLEKYAPYTTSREVWLSYADLLVYLKDWERLRGAALDMQDLARGQELQGPGCFYEAQADLATGRTQAAQRQLERSATAPYPASADALRVARLMLDLNQPEPAKKLLTRGDLKWDKVKWDNDQEYRKYLEYLEALFRVAVQLRDDDLLVLATRQAYTAQPRNPDYANRYAAALLIARQQPAQALELTLGILSHFPDSASARINHALALLLNHRPTDAQALLDPLRPEIAAQERLDDRLRARPLDAEEIEERLRAAPLTAEQIDAWYMATAELNLQLGRPGPAREALMRVGFGAMFPGDQRWYEQALRRLDALEQPKA